jgi:hypothetical protein
MKKYIFTLSVFLFVIKLPAQPTIEWQRSYGGKQGDQPYSIVQTTDGGYFVAGLTSSIEGDVFGNHGLLDVWALKLDSSGAIQWKKCYGGSNNERAYACGQTADGGYILAGQTRSNNWDVSGNHGDFDAWVLKLSPSGAIQWQKCLGGSLWDEARDIQQTPDGGYIMAGGAKSSDGDLTVNHGAEDYWVVKLSGMGDLEWQKTFGGSGRDIAKSVGLSNDGGYIVAGEAWSNDGQVTNSQGSADCWVVKLDAEGKIEWEKALGGTDLELGNDIQQTRDGGYIVVGVTRSNNGHVTGYHGEYDFWVIKLNNSGDIEWQKALGGSAVDYAKSIQQTSDDGYVMVGHTESTDGNVASNDGGADLWMVKLSASGVLQWEKAIGGTMAEEGNSIQQTTEGGFITTGYSWSSNGDVSENNGKTDFWVVKLSPETSPTSAPKYQPIEIYPNPSAHTITLRTGLDISENRSLLITDPLGREVLRTNFSSDGSVDVSALPNGLYFLTVTSGSGVRLVGKFRKQE